MMEMKILGEGIPYSEDYCSIDKLKFLRDNPRVYAVTHGAPEFDDWSPEQQQNYILEKLKEEPSVKNLKPDVVRHKGLIEPILVSVERWEVIEGNSRLAVYKILHEQQADGDWEFIPCHLVRGLTEAQRTAFLNQMHVKGKTQWSAYEKANFAYVRRDGGWTFDKIAEIFGESRETIRRRVSVIEMMRECGDGDKRRFSHYDVLIRTKAIWRELKEPCEFRDRIVGEIKKLNLDPDEDPDITAKDLRDKLPDIIKKPKILRRYTAGEIEFGEAHQRAKVSRAEERVKEAFSLLDDGISKGDIDVLDQNSLNALKQQVRKLERAVKRVRDMVDSRGGPG